jgi:hypothetical protein
MKKYSITSTQSIRRAFWQSHPAHYEYARKWEIVTAGHNRHLCETRTAFVDFVDQLHRAGEISDKLASRATL